MTKGFHTSAHYERESIMFESNYAKYCLPVITIHKDAEISSMSPTGKIKDQLMSWF